VFEAVGGYDECNLPIEFNDVDFCFRLRAIGKRVVCLPLRGIVHDESSSRKSIDPDAKKLISFDEREVPYDLLVTIPLNMGADFIARSNLQPGSRLSGVRIELDSDTGFDATLRLQHVSAMHGGGHGVRLGCEFIELDGQAQRALQRYIDHTQQRRRLLALR
jgi:hypothetical protein